MIGPKTAKPTAAEEKQAYAIAAGRDDLTCQRCLGWCGAPQQDHRQNRQPGNTVASNLQTLGLVCHQWKTEHPADALADGWAVPRWADPREWPARRWFRNTNGVTVRKGWCLYTNTGAVLEITEEEARQRMEGVT
ncbi:HNH endonuclease signature motif containing protein [Curtobacterium sp. MEB011]|uniref:HNH endonuclease signature motif containing protein n=1 Tax=Curtobacterium sp. MEB011 TaxID=3040285 RepID=UPI00254DBF88|nr:HNH endonuclease signature motif containing protein [Curtobacterium sp. MEB011]